MMNSKTRCRFFHSQTLLAYCLALSAGCSDDTLSRKTAARVLGDTLMKIFQEAPVPLPLGEQVFTTNSRNGPPSENCFDIFLSHLILPSADQKSALSRAVAGGLLRSSHVRTEATGHSGWFGPEYRVVCNFEISKEAEPFVRKRSGSAIPIVSSAKLRSVTGISKPGDVMGVRVSQVNYTYSLEPTGVGRIIANADTAVERQAQAVFQLYDDGWRLEGLGDVPGKVATIGQ